MKKTILGVVVASVVALGASGCVVASDGTVGQDGTPTDEPASSEATDETALQPPPSEPAMEDNGTAEESNALTFDPITVIAVCGELAKIAKDASEAYRNMTVSDAQLVTLLNGLDTKLDDVLAKLGAIEQQITDAEWKLESIEFANHYHNLQGRQETLRQILLGPTSSWPYQVPMAIGDVTTDTGWYSDQDRCMAPDGTFSFQRAVVTEPGLAFGAGLYLAYHAAHGSMNYALLDQWATQLEWIADQIDAYIYSGAKIAHYTSCDTCTTSTGKPCIGYLDMPLCTTSFSSCVFSKCVSGKITHSIRNQSAAIAQAVSTANANLPPLIAAVEDLAGLGTMHDNATSIRKGPPLQMIYIPSPTLITLH